MSAAATNTSHKESRSVSVVVPAYNEEATLEAAIERIVRTCDACAGDYEIIIADDCSSDGTPQVVAALKQKYPDRLTAVRHEQNQGIARTMIHLYELATREYVFLIPGDNEYPPEALHEIMPMLDECEIVVCRRVVKPYGGYRSLVSGCFHRLPHLLFGVETYDPGSTKCVRRDLYSSIPILSHGVFNEAERLIRAHYWGYKIGTVDIEQKSREGGVATGARTSLVVQAIVDMLRLWLRLVILRRDRKPPV